MCTIIKLFFLVLLDYFQEGFVPYRDSVLTWLLKDNLGMKGSFIFQKNSILIVKAEMKWTQDWLATDWFYSQNYLVHFRILMVSKCEVFDLLDSRYFYTINLPWVGDFGTGIKILKLFRFVRNFIVFFRDNVELLHANLLSMRKKFFVES